MRNGEKNKSVILKFSDKVSETWKRSYFSAAFIHDKGNKAKNSFILKKIRTLPIRKKVFTPLVSLVSKEAEKSVIIKKSLSLYEYFLSLSTKCIGWYALTFALVYLFLGILNNTISEFFLISCCVVSLAILPLLFSGKSIAALVLENKLLSFIFVDLLDCDKLEIYLKKKSTGNISGAIILGFLTGFLSLAFSPFDIFGFLFLVITTAVFLCRPETALLALSLSFAYLKMEIGNYLAIITIVSYFFKVLRGKRIFHIRFFDLPPVVFIVLILIFNAEQKDKFISVIVPLLYFAFSALMKTEKLLYKAVKNISLSITFVALYNIVFFIINLFKNKTFNIELLFDKEYVFFTNNNSLVLLYSIAFVILFCILIFGEENKSNIFFGLLINLSALYFCKDELALFACFLAIVLLFLIFLKNKILVLVVSSACCAVIFRFVCSFSEIMQSVKDAFEFSNRYKSYLIFGVENSKFIFDSNGKSDAGSLFTQILFWGGIIAFICVILFFVTFFRNGISCSITHSKNKLKIIASSVGCSMLVFAITSMGAFTWKDKRLFVLFWIFGGISSAIRSHSEKERLILEIRDQY